MKKDKRKENEKNALTHMCWLHPFSHFIFRMWYTHPQTQN